MNNDELKKKIVKVLQELRASKPIVPNDYGLQIISCTTDREIADALISAGIGDTSDLEVKCEVLQRDVDNLTRTMEEMAKKNNILYHALWNKCYENAGTGMPFNCNRDKCEAEMEAPCCRETATDCFVKEAIKQAEKELAEERKND